MGKPYLNELTKLQETYKWASDISPAKLQVFLEEARSHPLVAVGSGGSVTAAHFAALLHEHTGGIAKVCTPLEIIELGISLRGCCVLLLSAGGRNADILGAFETAARAEPHRLMALTLQEETPLAQSAKQFRFAQCFAATPPCGKDGFLATNSLIAFLTLLARAADHTFSFSWPESQGLDNLREATKQVCERENWAVLHADWARPAAMDIESKLTEAALGAVQLADYRNFGHGRHHWFAKREHQSAIVSLSTPQNQLLADKTLALLPDTIPHLRLQTSQMGAAGTLDLLVQSLHLVAWVGKARGIDPGRPGVPDYGSRLYHLRVPKSVATPKSGADAAIQRKLSKPIESLSEPEIQRLI